MTVDFLWLFTHWEMPLQMRSQSIGGEMTTVMCRFVELRNNVMRLLLPILFVAFAQVNSPSSRRSGNARA